MHKLFINTLYSTMLNSKPCSMAIQSKSISKEPGYVTKVQKLEMLAEFTRTEGAEQHERCFPYRQGMHLSVSSQKDVISHAIMLIKNWNVQGRR